MATAKTIRIVILGGGFGGMYAAIELEKKLAGDPGVEITLVNKDNFFLFTPMLHEVAASDLDASNIVNPVRKLLKKVKFFNGPVDAVDLEAKKVVVSHGSSPHSHDLEYDHLVLALGTITNFYNLPGLEERALTIKSIGDAILLRNRLIEHLEEADFECRGNDRQRLLTFVVAGGGFAGVETVAGINDFLRQAIPFYTNLTEQDLRVVLVHSGNVILPELGDKLGGYAQKVLAGRKLEIITNCRVASYRDGVVELNNGARIEAETLIWTAGTSPNPLMTTLRCKTDRGRLPVNEYLEVEGWPGVWALGDCAVVPDATTGASCPPTAQHALREGRVLARNIVATLKGKPMKKFRFKTIGQLAAIGRRTGVARIFGYNFSGFLAWWLWRTIYLSKLPRVEKRLRVTLDWTLDLFFSKDLVQLNTYRAPTISHTNDNGHLHHDAGTTPEIRTTLRQASNN
jgi:NADH:quinone reductase (non-electrogenic)